MNLRQLLKVLIVNCPKCQSRFTVDDRSDLVSCKCRSIPLSDKLPNFSKEKPIPLPDPSNLISVISDTIRSYPGIRYRQICENFIDGSQRIHLILEYMLSKKMIKTCKCLHTGELRYYCD